MMKLRNRYKSFDGWVEFYEHDSKSTQSPMRFSIYLPSAAETKKLPILYWLSGLTCNEENFMHKAGAQQWLAKHQIICVAMDTSPRGCNLPGETASWTLGEGAGFYVNATEEPWVKHYRMYDYVVHELPELLSQHFKIDRERQGIFGHSMGGHGALVIGLRNPELFTSISAFAPICAPPLSPWGKAAFTSYLGEDPNSWKEYDASHLVLHSKPRLPILIDQGMEDASLKEGRLLPEKLLEASQQSNYPIQIRMHEGYDHSYYFVASFLSEHLAFHAQAFQTKAFSRNTVR